MAACKTLFALSASLVAITMPVAAQAQSMSPEDAAALKAEIAALKAQIAALEAKVDGTQSGQMPATMPVPAVAIPAPEPKPDARPKAPAPEISFKGAPEIKTADGWSFKPRGRIHYDVGSISTPGAFTTPNLGFNSRVRRGRLGAEGAMPGGFGYKVDVDFANSATSFGEVFLSYKAKDSPVLVRIGNFDTLNGMEQITSSNNITFLERAAFNDAFLNSRRLGAAVAYISKDDAFRAEAGLFAAHSIDSSFDNNGWIAAGRLVYAPTLGKNQLHFGLGVQYRDFASNAGGVTSTGVNMPSTNQLARYRARPNSQLTDVRFVDTGSFAARRDRIIGVEAAGIFGPFYVNGEAQWLSANAYAPGTTATGIDIFAGGNSAITPASDPGFFGGYVEAGWFITGETRGYKKGEGVWNRTKVLKPVGKGGSGAFQLAARYDYIDLDDSSLKSAATNNFTTGGTTLAAANTLLGRGGTQSSYLLALNWYPIDYVRFMLNYGKIDVQGGPVAILVNPTAAAPVDQRDYGVNLFALRMQVEF